MAGPYCAQCGQSPYKGKLTFKRAMHDFFHAVTNVERGFTHTVIRMTTSPGYVIKDFLDGKTRPYFFPARYAFILVTISTLILIKTGIFDMSQNTFYDQGEMSDTQRIATEQIQHYIKQFLNFFVLIQLPFNTLVSWLLFRRRGYNFAEHFVANTYIMGQLSLLGLIILPFYYFLPLEDFGMINMGMSLALSAAFFSFTFKQWFSDPWGESIARGVITSLLGQVLMIIGIFVLTVLVVLLIFLASKLTGIDFNQ